jgi:hypothetical protein
MTLAKMSEVFLEIGFEQASGDGQQFFDLTCPFPKQRFRKNMYFVRRYREDIVDLFRGKASFAADS